MQVTAEGDFAIVIPARFASSRFPGKPLVPLLGKPMIRHVWERCVQAVDTREVFVATDDERIRVACEAFGARVLMTGSGCLTGTDRVAEAARQLDHAFVVNVQGDEPMLDPADILAVAAAHRAFPAAVVNGMAPIDDERDYHSRNVPKVLAAPDGRLLYMSRAPVPADKSGAFRGAQRQVCIYAFSRQHLERFAACPAKTPLEAIEDIEILRFLEMGVEVRMVAVAGGSLAVDTPEDVGRVEHALRGA